MSKLVPEDDPSVGSSWDSTVAYVAVRVRDIVTPYAKDCEVVGCVFSRVISGEELLEYGESGRNVEADRGRRIYIVYCNIGAIGRYKTPRGFGSGC
jgi:hypothetical protein